MSINTQEIYPQAFQFLVEQFPEHVRDKLLIYTAEELYCLWRVVLDKPTVNKQGSISNLFMATIRAKVIRWLQGNDKHVVRPSAWGKLGRKYQLEFYAWIDSNYGSDEYNNDYAS